MLPLDSSYSVYTSYITFCFNVGYLCCVCVCELFATQHCKICVALWYLVRGDLRPVITLKQSKKQKQSKDV